MDNYRLCYISRNYRNTTSSGNKAKTDNEKTLQDLGAVNLGLAQSQHTNKIVAFFIDLSGVIKYVFNVRQNDVVVLQYPIKKYFSFICKVAHLRGAKTVTLIHDLGSFRRKKLTVQKEISRLSHTDYVIASNEVMKNWLKDHGFGNKLGALGLFDYRSVAHPNTAHTQSSCRRLVYAGVLAMRKNAFLTAMPDIIKSYELHVYGNRDGLSGLQDTDKMIFHDFAPADTFISTVDADFGLVWDGDSTDSCTGNFGEYLRWNSPHKVSFYLRAGLPVIIWRQAALASVIEAEGAGICIDNVKELDSIIENISDEQLKQLHANALRISARLNEGYFFSCAVKRALAEL